MHLAGGNVRLTRRARAARAFVTACMRNESPTNAVCDIPMHADNVVPFFPLLLVSVTSCGPE
jgi:hypothetical protein